MAQLQSYPLYDTLVSMNHSNLKIGDVGATIGKLPKENREIIYTFILHAKAKDAAVSFSSINSELTPKKISRSKALSLPFDGKTMKSGKGALYQFDTLPSECQHVICEYVYTLTSK
jgi:hypothetical protein